MEIQRVNRFLTIRKGLNPSFSAIQTCIDGRRTGVLTGWKNQTGWRQLPGMRGVRAYRQILFVFIFCSMSETFRDRDDEKLKHMVFEEMYFLRAQRK
jgi:hypothetical protein